MTGVYLAFVFVSVLLVLVVAPRIIFPLREIPGTFLDRTMAGAVGITAITVAAMYLFGVFGMLETFAILAVWAATWWIAKGRHQERGRLRRFAQSVFTWSDLAEQKGVGGAASELGGGATSRAGWRTRKRLSEWRRSYPGHGAMAVSLGVLGVLAYAAYLRFERALTHLELVPQDSYLALFTTKAVNNGEFLKEGIYPQGVIFWWSIIDRFYVFETHQFIRFMGPAMAVLELIALYWVVSRVTRSRAAGLLSLSIFGLFAGNPGLFVDWSRQIGAMVQEMGIAFAIVSLVYGANYMAEGRNRDLWLAGASLFVAATGHTATVIPLAIGYTAIMIAGLLTRSWTQRSFVRMVVVGLAAVVVAHVYFPIGWLKGIPLVQSFEFYDPSNVGGFATTIAEGAMRGQVGEALRNNSIFQLGFGGALLAAVIGLLLAAAKRDVGKRLLAYGGASLGMMIAYDFVLVRYGLLFRVRMSWVAAVFMVIGVGLALGALVSLVGSLGQVRDVLHERLEGSRRLVRTGLELAALAVAVVIVAALWPSHHSVARTVAPSGYPQATEVSTDIISSEDKLTYTLVGVSEQFQEAAFNGWFVEAWVFAKDITFSDARDPAHEIPVPTNTVYVFVEKEVFEGPQSRPFGPTEEYYRNTTKRERIMQRILLWMEEYRRFHDDVEVFYEDAQLRVYRIERTVDLSRAQRSPAFKDYTWRPGELFNDDGDITADRVEPDPEASTLPAPARVPG